MIAVQAERRSQGLDDATKLQDLKSLPGNRFEALRALRRVRCQHPVVAVTVDARG